MAKNNAEMEVLALLQVMQQLRQSCEWTKGQTPSTLTAYAIEEAYEVENAVRHNDIANIKEELGDLLLQVIFQSQLYSEQGHFDFFDVVKALKEKLIRRSPHVFQNNELHYNLEDAQRQWQVTKQLEQSRKQEKSSLLHNIGLGPAIIQAEKIQKLAGRIGFDFPDIDAALDKVWEEYQELSQTIQENQKQEIIKEYGDSLFALINVGRKLGISGEIALLGTIDKFRKRFEYIEQQALLQGKKIEDLSLEQMDILWEDSKKYKEYQ